MRFVVAGGELPSDRIDTCDTHTTLKRNAAFRVPTLRLQCDFIGLAAAQHSPQQNTVIAAAWLLAENRDVECGTGRAAKQFVEQRDAAIPLPIIASRFFDMIVFLQFASK